MSTKRLMHELKLVERSLDHYHKDNNYYYLRNEANIRNGTLLLFGVEDSPYFGGFYFFDTNFSEQHPFVPISLTFLSNDGRTRFNPNLYIEGKVCLSIIGTWGESSWSQIELFPSVIESVRAHLFHDNPLINEPGYPKSGPDNEIYARMITYQNLNFNVYHNIVNTPEYAKPFKQIMIENFLVNIEYFKKYIEENKHLHGKTEYIAYASQRVTYDFEQLEKKLQEIISICK